MPPLHLILAILFAFASESEIISKKCFLSNKRLFFIANKSQLFMKCLMFVLHFAVRWMSNVMAHILRDYYDIIFVQFTVASVHLLWAFSCSSPYLDLSTLLPFSFFIASYVPINSERIKKLIFFIRKTKIVIKSLTRNAIYLLFYRNLKWVSKQRADFVSISEIKMSFFEWYSNIRWSIVKLLHHFSAYLLNKISNNNKLQLITSWWARRQSIYIYKTRKYLRPLTERWKNKQRKL